MRKANVCGTCVPGCRQMTGGRGGLTDNAVKAWFPALHMQRNKRQDFMQGLCKQRKIQHMPLIWRKPYHVSTAAFTHTASSYGDGRQHNCAHWQQH